MKSKLVFKIFAITFLLLASYHLTGIESAFCKDTGLVKVATTQGCEICQPGHHVAVNLDGRILTPQLIPVVFTSTAYLQLQKEEFSLDFFRPPIAL